MPFEIAPPQIADLFSQTNGMLFIRQATPPGSQQPWRSTPTGTSKVEVARKRFARWLIKNKVEGVDAMTVPVQSTVGILRDDGGSLSKQIRERRNGSSKPKKKAKGKAMVPYDPAVANAAKARQALADKRARAITAETVLTKVKPILAALAASMEAAAINLRQVTDMIEEIEE